MSVNFCLYDRNGKIIKTGNCPIETIPFVNKRGCTLLIGTADQKKQKIVNGKIVDKNIRN